MTYLEQSIIDCRLDLEQVVDPERFMVAGQVATQLTEAVTVVPALHSYIPITLWLLTLVYFTVVKSRVVDLPEVSAIEVTQAYDRTANISEEKISLLTDPLMLAMDEDKLYLNAQLTLANLAEHIEASASDISLVLNLELKMNFYDFVNRYRVEEAKRLLSESQNKILAVAFDAGFNSKSNFNKLFKQHTGLTPSDYRKHAEQLLE